MPSPFPGIDPYVEAQGSWGDFHPSFITYCCDSLNELLPDRYVASSANRFVLVDLSRREARRLLPDVADPRTAAQTRLACRTAEGGGWHRYSRASDDSACPA